MIPIKSEREGYGRRRRGKRWDLGGKKGGVVGRLGDGWMDGRMDGWSVDAVCISWIWKMIGVEGICQSYHTCWRTRLERSSEGHYPVSVWIFLVLGHSPSTSNKQSKGSDTTRIRITKSSNCIRNAHNDVNTRMGTAQKKKNKKTKKQNRAMSYPMLTSLKKTPVTAYHFLVFTCTRPLLSTSQTQSIQSPLHSVTRVPPPSSPNAIYFLRTAS